MKKISIVTVCFNCRDDIKLTLESVLLQECNDYEYIIKDGGSTDGTLDVVYSYIEKFQEKDIRIIVQSGQDDGIYSAMNQAVDICGETDWILFLNAGDVLYDKDVVYYVSRMKVDEYVGILIGHTEVCLHNNMKIIEKPILTKNKMIFCHQSTLVRTSLQKQNLFDLKYTIAADRDLILKIKTLGYQIKLMGIIISKFDKKGISSKRYDILFKEADCIDKKYGIEHRKHSVVLNYVKTKITNISPLWADLVYVWKRIRG